ncbi:putative flagellum biosynthesis repressor protein FlbT [Beijerinckiaceae bacterium RH AL1]|nr:flagellar biosynthesis repressor FlbT [Beijerinckiaceae bacterium]VVB43206.1 putative flagellum biosynthesis repressor protein FlbT [Beijerinckiaceae bacterium RH AL8]VVB43221.1 putative flagellum biosynthesis repressor protein FlbT [Beijerinckiaceae bacterium RH CH11]VVC53724.1 putative flagellum biosynthesis repressor protein FlbT [Beijerinckiaceae bacterium RH AL1]
MHITLRAGERLFLNGAVIKADRKVSLELMNDATFLLEAHVMQPENATSPLRQLYFVVQTMLMSPAETTTAKALFDASLARMLAAYADAAVLAVLRATGDHVADGRYFDALKGLRGAFLRDDALMMPAAALAIAS